MNDNAKGVAGLVVLLLIFTWWGSVVSLTLYGAFLAFSASVILGLCFLLIPPLMPLMLISGALKLFLHFNLPEKILELMK